MQAIGAAPVPAPAPPPVASVRAIEQSTLPNGLKVVLATVPGGEDVYVNVVYQAGSSDEQPHEFGYAHLFEHVSFKVHGEAPSYDKEATAMGADVNAWTTTDRTVFTSSAKVNRVNDLVDLNARRMRNIRENLSSVAVSAAVAEVLPERSVENIIKASRTALESAGGVADRVVTFSEADEESPDGSTGDIKRYRGLTSESVLETASRVLSRSRVQVNAEPP